MELYLRWLDKHEREPEEASPLGIILCTGKKREQIELLELDKSGIHVAEYLTALPPRGVLVERLQQATQRAQLQIEQRKTDNESTCPKQSGVPACRRRVRGLRPALLAASRPSGFDRKRVG